jgi:hypothetical protein
MVMKKFRGEILKFSIGGDRNEKIRFDTFYGFSYLPLGSSRPNDEHFRR